MVHTRREVLWLGAAGLGALAVPRRLLAEEGTPIEPGLQLYTVRNLLEEDYAGTLAAIAAIGYREVQVSPRAGHTPEAIRAMLDAAGLVAPSIHLDLQNTTEQEIEAAQALGAKYVYLSAPPRALKIENGRFRGIRDDLRLDVWRQIADELDETGAKFEAAGLVYGYHNHGFEFPKVEGVVPFELLLERTDPGLVSVELDLGWLHKAGADPLPYIERYPGRFPVVHVKDVDREGNFTDPGSGVVDFARTFARASQAGMQHYFVEHDSTKDPLGTARAGFARLETQRAG